MGGQELHHPSGRIERTYLRSTTMPRRGFLRVLLLALLLLSVLTPVKATWTEDTSVGSTKSWQSIASSSDGTKLAAFVQYGNIWTSADSGANWTEDTSVGSTKNWLSITSSSDGTKLATTVWGGNIWTFEAPPTPPPSTPSANCVIIAPEHGSLGVCLSTLGPGGGCTPDCDDGYTVSGLVTCSLEGNVSLATCDIVAVNSTSSNTTSLSPPPPNTTVVSQPPPPPPPNRLIAGDDYESSATRYSVVMALVVCIINLYITTISQR